MDKFVINGGTPLSGKVAVQSAKNSVLPIMAAAVLCRDDVVINNCPRLADIIAMKDIIVSLGGRCEFDGDKLIMNCADVQPNTIDRELSGKIRSSIFVLGAIISRFRRARVSYPGGCEIGLRPIDIHLKGLARLGVKINGDDGSINCDGSEMNSGTVVLDFPSVGATENILLASVFLSGTTIIENVAREPEIVDLANFINALGGKVSGAGSSVITVTGVRELHGCEYTPIPDRIYAGTLMCAAAFTRGDVFLYGARASDMSAVIEKLCETGAKVDIEEGGIRIQSTRRLQALNKIETLVYPGFPTDMQAQFCAMLIGARGTSMIVENLFENRYRYTTELIKLGAKIDVKDRVAIVRGVNKLSPNVLLARDLRGGAALTVAALGISGVSEVEFVEHIDRGYYNLEDTYRSLGADVRRETVSE